MESALAHLWRHHRVLLLVFVAGLAASLLLAVRLIVVWVYWSDPDHRMVRPEGWMTIGYIARSWELPPEAVLAMIPAERTPGHPPTLAEVAARTGESLPELIARIDAALRETTRTPPP